MKANKYIVALLAGLAAISCNKEISNELPAPQDAKDLITIRATIPDTDTKGAHVGFSWYWNANDKLTVIGEEGSEVFSIKEGYTAKFAEFVGKPVAGSKFTIMYPNDKADATDFSKQTQVGNNSYDHLKYVASLDNVDDYLSFSFSPEWAAEHGGTLRQSGVLKLVIALPDSIASVSHISLASETPLFYGSNGTTMTNKLELDLQNAVPDEKHNLTAWMTTSWNEVVVPAGTTLTLGVKTDKVSIEKDVLFSKESVLLPGKVNTFTPDGKGWMLPSHYASGKGTAEKPWVIVNADQMTYIKDDLVEGEIRYFKLGADIDMKGITDWTPVNGASPYKKQIDFDGAGHTISNFSCSAASYPSFFGVLYGKCHDVKFTKAVINAASKGCGILGGYGGTSGLPCEVSKVHVQGTITSTAGNNVGGLFGTAREATITACSADVVIDCKGQMNGGLIGADAGLGVTIRDCWTSGSISSTASICGGICGDLVGTGSSIINCFSTASVSTQFIFGGIAGRACAGQKTNKANCEGKDPQNHIEKCIAWNAFLKSDFITEATPAEHYSSGIIIGGTAIKNYLVGCIRKADISFTDCPKNAELGTYLPFDQEDASPEVPMVKGAGTYAYAYHGKAAAAGKTLSQVAKDLGWSTDVWDFSGDTPKLK